MENEIRYYLKKMQEAMAVEDEATKFVPTHLVTAIQLPTGAIEIAINTDGIQQKIDYILAVYNEDMQLTANTMVVMKQLMIV